MNAPVHHRSILRHHVATIEAKHPVRIIGILPQGSVGHVSDTDGALKFLAEKREGLSYFGLAQAERDLGELMGRPVGIVLMSELSGSEVQELPASAQPL